MTEQQERPLWNPEDHELLENLFSLNFGAAEQQLREDHPHDVREIVIALATTFGSKGRFWVNSMEIVAKAAIAHVFHLLSNRGAEMKKPSGTP